MASLGRGGDDVEPQPRFAAGGPDADEFGAAAGYPTGDRATFFATASLVGSHSHLDEILPGRLIHKAPAPSRLVRVAEPRITWTFQGVEWTLDDYLARNPTTGLLVARGDTIFVERYQYGRTDRHRFTSWSMAKTVMDATTVRADQPHLRPGTATPIFGYGYQTWILPTKRRMFMLWRIRGQRIFVDPDNKLVMVNTAVHKLPADLAPLEEMGALWFGVVRQLGPR